MRILGTIIALLALLGLGWLARLAIERYGAGWITWIDLEMGR